MAEILDCSHSDRKMMLGERGKGIAQWCKECGAHNPGENCDWELPRFRHTLVSEEVRHQLDRTYERIEDLEKRLVKERVEHGETYLRCQRSDELLRKIKLAMPHVEAGYDAYDAKLRKLEAELEECGDKIGRQAEQIEHYRYERDRHRDERNAALATYDALRQSIGSDVHEVKDMEADLRNYRAKEAHYRDAIGSVWSVLNNESDAHKKHDAS